MTWYDFGLFVSVFGFFAVILPVVVWVILWKWTR